MPSFGFPNIVLQNAKLVRRPDCVLHLPVERATLHAFTPLEEALDDAVCRRRYRFERRWTAVRQNRRLLSSMLQMTSRRLLKR